MILFTIILQFVTILLEIGKCYLLFLMADKRKTSVRPCLQFSIEDDYT